MTQNVPILGKRIEVNYYCFGGKTKKFPQKVVLGKIKKWPIF